MQVIGARRSFVFSTQLRRRANAARLTPRARDSERHWRDAASGWQRWMETEGQNRKDDVFGAVFQ